MYKTLTPRIKNVKKCVFTKKIKNVKKRRIKTVVDKLTELFKPNEKFSSKITVLVAYNVHDNVWETRILIREFPRATMFRIYHLKSFYVRV